MTKTSIQNTPHIELKSATLPGLEESHIAVLWSNFADNPQSSEALNTLVAHYIPFARRLCERHAVQKSLDPDSLESEVLYRLPKLIKSFDVKRGGPFETYVAMATERAAKDRLRMRYRERNRKAKCITDNPGSTATLELGAVLSSGSIPNSFDHLSFVKDYRSSRPENGIQRSELVDFLLRGLPPKEQKLLRLRFLENYSLIEASQRIDGSYAGTCRRISSALSRIRTRLEGLGIDKSEFFGYLEQLNA